ncbi:MAG: helix-turn-helix transcriptional regulator [Deltaproteobacteria bacterium]|nr:helix-turn-helix transcriptional regulator [Deltaproteobacteria bacterium]
MNWREVEVKDLGSGRREFARTAGGLAWRYDARLCGLAATASTHEDIRALLEATLLLCARGEAPMDMVSDVSRVVVSPENATALAASHEHSERLTSVLRRVLGRQAGLVARGWAAPYWKALNEHAGAPWKVETFFEREALWGWLGTDPATAREIDALVDEQLAVARPLATLRSILKADPATSLAEAARRLALSSRSLQRLLADHGETFNEVRARARMARAMSLLSDGDLKIHAIAEAVGFASPSHFTTWFQQLRGVSPSEFRASTRR